MKKVTLVLVMALMSLMSYAQQDAVPVMKYGYLSYDSVFQAMPEYATMQANLQVLREKYEAEQKRVEDDFNKKYEEFLDGQASFPKSILQKRQSELQEMLDKNIAFKKECLRLLSQAEDEAKAPLKQRLAAVLAQVGEARGYAFILNTDGNVAPWLNAAMAEDCTEAVKTLLK
jgi:outer membrane protein